MRAVSVPSWCGGSTRRTGMVATAFAQRLFTHALIDTGRSGLAKRLTGKLTPEWISTGAHATGRPLPSAQAATAMTARRRAASRAAVVGMDVGRGRDGGGSAAVGCRTPAVEGRERGRAYGAGVE